MSERRVGGPVSEYVWVGARGSDTARPQWDDDGDRGRGVAVSQLGRGYDGAMSGLHDSPSTSVVLL